MIDDDHHGDTSSLLIPTDSELKSEHKYELFGTILDPQYDSTPMEDKDHLEGVAMMSVQNLI